MLKDLAQCVTHEITPADAVAGTEDALRDARALEH